MLGKLDNDPQVASSTTSPRALKLALQFPDQLLGMEGIFGR